ncbi:MAG TPA: sigma-70 family RNA polymerase sigma factor [Pirellulaceae bacterium]
MTSSSLQLGSSKPPSTKVSLLARLRRGADATSWRTFVELYTPLIYRFCRRRELQDADAQDVTQKVMARVYIAISKFTYDARRGHFRNWLGVIAAREIYRHQQLERRPGQRGGHHHDELSEQTPGPPEGDWFEEFNSHVLAVALQRIRGDFDDITWRAFDWTWLQSLKPQAAAERLNRPPEWVYKARFRVLKRLRAEVEFLAEDAANLQRPG